MPRRESAPRDLLFGLLALQNGMVGRDQLVAAFAVWNASSDSPLSDLLAEQAGLGADERALLAALVENHIKRHSGDPEASLAALDVDHSTRESLANSAPAVEATLAHIGSGSTFAGDGDSESTRTYAVGTTTSDGQRFRVLRPHARGGLGAVFVALDNELNREVALKQILDHHADDPVSRQRFVVEAEITGGLEHPGIVPVYGLGNYDNGRPFYAMRFVRGDSLKEAIGHFHADERLRRDPGARSLELRKLLRRFTDVCNAIQYAHDRGVLHRDIKPGNVIVGKHGETLVIDWGLAKPIGKPENTPEAGERTLVPSSASGSAETLPGSALGTPAYMSPEQAAGDLDRLGPRSDVYSLGATLYCLLTGKPPFEGDAGEALRAVQRGDFQAPCKVDPSVDKALEAVCLTAMALRPEDRYASCRALTEDIERWSADEPVSVHRESLPTRLTRWGRRHRTAAASVAVLLVTAVAALTVGAALINRERSKAEANFRLARSAVDKYFTTVSESRLLQVPGMQPLRKELLESAESYYRDFLQKHGDDPSVRADAAAATFRLGWVNKGIGRPEEAFALLKKATSLYEPLVREHLGDAESRRSLASCHGALGLHFAEKGAIDEALREHREALKLREALAKADPGDIRVRNDVARTHRNIGDVFRQVGKVDAALAEWDLALAIEHELLRAPADGGDARVELTGRRGLSDILRDDLAGLQLDRTNLLRESGRRASAEAALRESRNFLDVLLREHPGDLAYRNRLGDVYSNEGSLLVDRGQLVECERAYRRAMAIFQELSTANPTVSSYRSSLAEVTLKLGWTLGRTSRVEEALTLLRRGVELGEGLLADNPGSNAYRGLMARGLTQIGNLLLREGQPVEAIPSLRRGLDLHKKITRELPMSVQHQSALTNALRGVGRAEAAAGHPAAARDCFERASKIDEALALTYPIARYNLACSLALLIPVSEPDRREALAVRAIEELRTAISAGYGSLTGAQQDHDLDALRDRPDFQSLMDSFRTRTVAEK